MNSYHIIKEFNLNEKESFFISYYLYTITLLKKGSSKFEVFNLHSLCKTIIEEITKNNISRNLKFFQEKLRNILKIDYWSKNYYKYEVNEIINNMTSNNQYALIVANNFISKLDDGRYGKKICDRINKLIFSIAKIDDVKEELKYLINALIVEYVIYGYDQKNIEDIIYNVFSKYQVYNDYVLTNYPMSEEFNNNINIIKFIDNLYVEDRIKALKMYFEKKKKKYYYMFNIKGIVGDYLDIHLNNVNIYNWKTKHKFKIEIQENKPVTYQKGNFEENSIHCSIMIESICEDSKFEQVKQELDEALDILNFYHNFNCKLEVDYSKYIIFNEYNEFEGEGITYEYDENFKRNVNPLNYNYLDNQADLSEKYNKYSDYILNKNNRSSQIIKNSIRYYRKAKESDRLEDKILNYWICLESIFNINIELPQSILDKNENDKKFNKIYSLSPYIILKNEIIAEFWNVYEYFRKVYDENSNLKEISMDDLQKLQFKTENINLLEFVKNYKILKDSISEEIDKNIYLNYFNILYNTNHAMEYIGNCIRKSKESILLLYRFRNMIVHNAQYDITFSKLYVKQFELLVGRVLNMIIDDYYNSNGEKTLENVIVEQYINQKRLSINLKSQELIEWFCSQ